MTSDVKDSTLPENDAGASDWENRRLCSDENCIGVIGADGRCKECGRPGDPSVVSSEPHPEIRAAAVPAAPPPASDPPGAADDDWENRRLCSDENCIGVIGADSRCRECGKPYAG